MVTNPVATRELKAILIERRSTVALLAYLGLLSVGMYAIWPRTEEVAALSAQIARKIFVDFAACQIILLAVLTPVFAAGALTQEKEWETLELLLASPIPIDRIVRGKLWSAVAFLFTILFSSLPIVWIILPLGGLTGTEVLGLYAMLALLTVGFTLVAVTTSAHFHRTHSAFVVSYLLLLPAAALGVAILYSTEGQIVASCVALCLLAGGTAVAWQIFIGVAGDRAQREISEPPRPAGEEDPDAQVGLVLRPGFFPDDLLLPVKSAAYIPDQDNPVYHKELRSELLGSGTLFARIVIQISLFLSILFIPQVVTGQMAWFLAYLVLVAALITPALCSGTFSQERERGMLDQLLGTLLTPGEVVRGKLRSLVRYSAIMIGMLLAAHVVTYLFSLRASAGPVLTGLDHLGAYLIVLVVAVLGTALVSCYASILTLSTFGAMMCTYVTLLALYLGPLAVYVLLTMFTGIPESSLAWVTLTSPFGPLVLDPSGGLFARPLALWHAHVLFWGVAIALLARLTMRRYEALQRGQVGEP